MIKEINKNPKGYSILAKPNQVIFEPNRKIAFKDLYTGVVLFGRIGDIR